MLYWDIDRKSDCMLYWVREGDCVLYWMRKRERVNVCLMLYWGVSACYIDTVEKTECILCCEGDTVCYWTIPIVRECILCDIEREWERERVKVISDFAENDHPLSWLTRLMLLQWL